MDSSRTGYSIQLPLFCPLFINGEEGKPTGDNYAQPVEGIWGGYKQSGIGRELGYYGLEDFLEVKQIFTDGTGLVAKPAYGQLIKE